MAKRIKNYCWLMMVCLTAAIVSAHEGHKPLPTRGMEINAETGKMVLTKSARSTLDVQTAEVGPQKVSQSLLAYGTRSLRGTAMRW